jgi:hypothetical protein
MAVILLIKGIAQLHSTLTEFNTDAGTGKKIIQMLVLSLPYAEVCRSPTKIDSDVLAAKRHNDFRIKDVAKGSRDYLASRWILPYPAPQKLLYVSSYTCDTLSPTGKIGSLQLSR